MILDEQDVRPQGNLIRPEQRKNLDDVPRMFLVNSQENVRDNVQDSEICKDRSILLSWICLHKLEDTQCKTELISGQSCKGVKLYKLHLASLMWDVIIVTKRYDAQTADSTQLLYASTSSSQTAAVGSELSF